MGRGSVVIPEHCGVTDEEAVDIGLCYGWISGQRKYFDEVCFLQKYMSRRPRSGWSQVNVAKVEELSAPARMRPSGIAEVEAAKSEAGRRVRSSDRWGCPADLDPGRSWVTPISLSHVRV
jgi:uncharacterized protein YdeI (YjbR/CyaY-like superfamily)